MGIHCLQLIQTHYKTVSGKSGINNGFESIRTQRNSSTHQSNRNHNKKISKAAPAMFKIHRTWHSINKRRTHKSIFQKSPLDVWREGILLCDIYPTIKNIDFLPPLLVGI